MAKEYIEANPSGLFVAGTRVSLASVVFQFRRGASPESILQSFPSLTSLENVYGAITWYLANQDTVDEYLDEQQRKWEEFRQSADAMPPSLDVHLEGIRR